jgi:hypothetical protein
MATPRTRFSTFQRNALGPVFQGAPVTPTLLNGTGALNAPALEQDAAWPMAKALLPDRYLVWKTSNATPAGNNAVKYDVDLGADRAIQIVSLHGTRGIKVAEGLFPSPLAVRASYRTEAQGYDGTGTFAAFGGDAPFGGYRDAVIDAGADVALRYLRISFSDTSTLPFSVGRIFAGASPDVDLPMIYWAGSSDTIVVPSIITDSGAMGPVVTIIGETHDEYSILLAAIDDATLALVRLLRATRQSFLYYRHDGTVRECIIVGMHSSATVVHLPPGLNSIVLDLLGLA